MLVGAGLTRLYYAMIEAPWLRLEEIEITGLKKLDRIEILNTMGLRRGQCALSIDVGSVAERLKRTPAVKDASVRFETGGRIVATIVEREPAAVVKCGERYIQMDTDGNLFSETTVGEKGGLPLITGLCDSNMKAGDWIGPRSLALIKEFLEAVEHSKSWLAGTAINECAWTENGFTLVLGERAVPVDIGQDAFEQKITKLRNVINTLNERNWGDLVTRIDLDYPGRAFLEGGFPVPKAAHAPAKQPG
jgi:hypothetical protein